MKKVTDLKIEDKRQSIFFTSLSPDFKKCLENDNATIISIDEFESLTGSKLESDNEG